MTTNNGAFPSETGLSSASPIEPPGGVSPVPASIPCGWWCCLHCGHDKYESHTFTGNMAGVPMVHCAACLILHSPPDPESKRALRWRNNELRGLLADIARIANDYDLREAIDDIADSFIWRDLIEAADAIAMEAKGDD